MSNFSQRFIEPLVASVEGLARRGGHAPAAAEKTQAGVADADVAGLADLAALHADAAALGELPARAALSSLIARLLAARVLREHHLWEAARILPLLAEMEIDVRHWRPFRALMEAQAFADAARLLAQVCSPQRELIRMNREPVSERYVVICDCRGRPHRRRAFAASHGDLAAAMLIALLRSFAGPRPALRRRAEPHPRP